MQAQQIRAQAFLPHRAAKSSRNRGHSPQFLRVPLRPPRLGAIFPLFVLHPELLNDSAWRGGACSARRQPRHADRNASESPPCRKEKGRPSRSQNAPINQKERGNYCFGLADPFPLAGAKADTPTPPSAARGASGS